jgi:Flp pilus assembly protein TadB
VFVCSPAPLSCVCGCVEVVSTPSPLCACVLVCRALRHSRTSCSPAVIHTARSASCATPSSTVWTVSGASARSASAHTLVVWWASCLCSRFTVSHMCAVCCVLCVAYCVLCAVCCVLYVVCCVLCAAWSVMCGLLCVVCAVPAAARSTALQEQLPQTVHAPQQLQRSARRGHVPL